jgi:DNA adenine methylase
MTDLMNLFNDLDRQTSEKDPKDRILRAPFGYPGGKTRSLANIIKHLPYKPIYVEPFGGSASLLLARQPVKLEVFNDRYAGVVAFYRCLRHPEKYKQLIDYLELTVHSREDFIDAKQTWCDESDDVIRAAKWYYMISYSFGSLGRNFGRSISMNGVLAGKITNKLKYFPLIHSRLQKVQIENQDWKDCLHDYDSKDTVFYIDPPYIDAYPGTYEIELNKKSHIDLIGTIFHLKGFVALSGYSNPIYENRDWDARYAWDSFVSIDPCAFTETNYKENLKCSVKRQKAEEILWIKEVH